MTLIQNTIQYNTIFLGGILAFSINSSVPGGVRTEFPGAAGSCTDRQLSLGRFANKYDAPNPKSKSEAMVPGWKQVELMAGVEEEFKHLRVFFTI